MALDKSEEKTMANYRLEKNVQEMYVADSRGHPGAAQPGVRYGQTGVKITSVYTSPAPGSPQSPQQNKSGEISLHVSDFELSNH